MARKTTKKAKRSSRKDTSRVHEMIDVTTEDLIAPPPAPAYRRRSTRPVILLLLVLAIIGLLVLNKHWIVVALVNGKPIFRWELNSALVSRFGKQTLEGLISERLIADAAKQAGVTVSREEVQAKEDEIVSGLAGDVNLEDLLKLQGMTREDFDSQITLQLTVEKLLSKDVTINEEDITSYIATNRATLTATDEASLRQEARKAIIAQHVSEKIQPWFMELKDNAKILRFIE